MNGVFFTFWQEFHRMINDGIQAFVYWIPNLIAVVLLVLMCFTSYRVLLKLVSRLFCFKTVVNFFRLFGSLEIVKWQRLVSNVGGLLIVLFFLLPIIKLLHLTSFVVLYEHLLAYLPNLILALFLGLFGLAGINVVVGLLKNSLASYEFGNTAANVGRIVLIFVLVIFCLSQIGVQTNILVYIFLIVTISIGFMFSLSVGLGSKNVIENILAGVFLKEYLRVGNNIKLDGIEGKIVEINSMVIIIENDVGYRIFIPNTLMVQKIIQ